MKYDDRYRSIFKTDLIEGAMLAGEFGFPVIHRTHSRPNRLISFDKAISCRDYSQWVHFYIPDPLFERIWRSPWNYLGMLSKYDGVISPDFSIPICHPQFVQLESVAKSRVIGSWLQRSGIDVIPNVRWGRPESYRFAFDSIEPGGTVAIGTLGCTKNPVLREVFREGLPELVRRIEPSLVVVYGAIHEPTLSPVFEAGIEIVHFNCQTSIAKEAS